MPTDIAAAAFFTGACCSPPFFFFPPRRAGPSPAVGACVHARRFASRSTVAAHRRSCLCASLFLIGPHACKGGGQGACVDVRSAVEREGRDMGEEETVQWGF